MKPSTSTDVPTVMLPLGKLEPMPGNREYGSGMDTKSLKELADSVKLHGIQQDLLVRPHPKKKDHFEIVFGCRRFAAAELAGLAVAPCKVRELSDKDALELRVVENLQREGIHPLEEAMEYQKLLDLRGSDGAAVHTWESIGQRIGKSAVFVRGRVKLLKMPKLAQDASLNGKCNPSIALMLARIPDPKLAHQAALDVLAPGTRNEKDAIDISVEPMSVRQAKDHIQSKYMIRLKGARFDQTDKDLLAIEWRITAGEKELIVASNKPPLCSSLEEANPDIGGSATANAERYKTVVEFVKLAKKNKAILTCDRVAGGPCGNCPFRTGNMKGLFPDVDSADVCTNTPCFQRKTKAAEKIVADRYRDRGQKLLSESQAARLLGDDDTLTVEARAEYIDLGECPKGKKKTWKELLEIPDTVKPLVARGKRVHLLLPIADAIPLANKAGVKLAGLPTRSRAESVETKAKDDEAEGKRAALYAMNEELIPRSLNLLSDAIRKNPVAEAFRYILVHDFGMKECDVIGLGVENLALTFCDLRFHGRAGQNHEGELAQFHRAACDTFGVDLTKLRADIEAEQAARRAEAEAQAAKDWAEAEALVSATRLEQLKQNKKYIMFTELEQIMKKGDTVAITVARDGDKLRVNVMPRFFSVNGRTSEEAKKMNEPLTLVGTVEELDGQPFIDELHKRWKPKRKAAPAPASAPDAAAAEQSTAEALGFKAPAAAGPADPAIESPATTETATQPVVSA